MARREDRLEKTVAANRKALRDYSVLQRFETGIELVGTEVKAIRNGQANFAGSFARAENEELMLFNLNIPAYEYGNRFNHEPTRPRRLLMHKREIRRLQGQVDQKGLALIPLRLYFKSGWVKVELGLCKGKAHADKRETLRRKTLDREAQRALASRGRN
jgi:SsrA-binding protein